MRALATAVCFLLAFGAQLIGTHASIEYLVHIDDVSESVSLNAMRIAFFTAIIAVYVVIRKPAEKIINQNTTQATLSIALWVFILIATAAMTGAVTPVFIIQFGFLIGILYDIIAYYIFANLLLLFTVPGRVRQTS